MHGELKSILWSRRGQYDPGDEIGYNKRIRHQRCCDTSSQTIRLLRVKEGRVGSTPDKGVPDMTCISDIDENGINRNLKVRYERDQIYVSFSTKTKTKKRAFQSQQIFTDATAVVELKYGGNRRELHRIDCSTKK
ncbi:hypothetical protein RP20_CCG019429 [Aedes albopictus]|nr:hypothetical protein RP20_CCG019429 [Aedes albopictus]